MSEKRRKSSRANNATNEAEKQKLAVTLKRRAVSARPDTAAVAVEAAVLGEGFYANARREYDKYVERSPQLRRAEEGGGGGGRASRRRGGGSSGGGASDGGAGAPAAGGDGGGGESVAEREAARQWEEHGHTFLAMLEPLVTPRVALPKSLQEAAMHLLLNAAHHRTDLSARALALLERHLAAHPPARLQGGALVVSELVWDPVTCGRSGRWETLDAPRFLGLRQGGGLVALLASARNAVAAAAAAAAAAGAVAVAAAARERNNKDAAAAPPAGDLGEVLLLRYWLAVLEADLSPRLAGARAAGLSREWRAHMANSLAVRIMQTITNWADGTDSKPQLIRLAADTLAYGHMAAAASAAPPPSGQPPTAAAPGGAAGGAAAAAAAAAGPGGGGVLGAGSPLCGPGEVAALGGRLLGMLYGAYGTLYDMWAYVRQGALGVENDLVLLDRTVAKALQAGALAASADAGAFLALLSALPPPCAVRLLVYVLAEAAHRRLLDCRDTPGALRALAEHYADKGGGEPVRACASDALRYLLAEGEAAEEAEGAAPPAAASHRGRRGGGGGGGGGGAWGWAAGALRLVNVAPKEGLALYVAALSGAAMTAAQHAQRAAAATAATAAQAGAAADGDADAAAAAAAALRDGVAAAEAEAREVAALYVRAAERAEAEGVWAQAQAAVGVARRVADRLAARAAAAGAAA